MMMQGADGSTYVPSMDQYYYNEPPAQAVGTYSPHKPPSGIGHSVQADTGTTGGIKRGQISFGTWTNSQMLTTEWIRADFLSEWDHWKSRYYFYRILKVIHKWTWTPYSLSSDANSLAYALKIVVMPAQMDSNYSYSVAKEDKYGWRSLMHEGAKVYTITPGKTVTHTCVPRVTKEVMYANNTMIQPSTQWRRTDNVNMTTAHENTITWCFFSSFPSTSTDNIMYWGDVYLPSDMDAIKYTRTCVVQFASEIDDVQGRI